MKHRIAGILLVLAGIAGAGIGRAAETGPLAALAFDARYRGDVCQPDQQYVYPQARGIPFEDTRNIIVMRSSLWRPAEICADFRRRMSTVPAGQQKQGIVVIVKTERCATKEARLCSITTAAFEKEATPLVHEFAIYGLQLKPRDGDVPPGSLKIETGDDAWKNEAAGLYGFLQGPGATLVVLDPADGRVVARTDAVNMHLFEKEFTALSGRTPYLEEFLTNALIELGGMPTLPVRR
jgi:hypothetical protein